MAENLPPGARFHPDRDRSDLLKLTAFATSLLRQNTLDKEAAEAANVAKSEFLKPVRIEELDAAIAATLDAASRSAQGV